MKSPKIVLLRGYEWIAPCKIRPKPVDFCVEIAGYSEVNGWMSDSVAVTFHTPGSRVSS